MNQKLTSISSKMKVPFFKISLTGQEIVLVSEVLNSSQWSSGEFTEKLEYLFELDSMKGYALATVNATSAFELIFSHIAHKRYPNRLQFYTSPIQWCGVINAMSRFGDIHFIDIDDTTWNMCTSKLKSYEKDLDENSVIVTLDLHGLISDYVGINDLAHDTGATIVHDAAHSLKLGDINVNPREAERTNLLLSGRYADYVVYSLYATKTLSAGEGGMICLDDSDNYYRIKSLRNHGISISPDNSVDVKHTRREVACPGYKFNMSNIHAAIALAQSKNTRQNFIARNLATLNYHRLLSEHLDKFEMPTFMLSSYGHSYHLYNILVKNERFIDSLSFEDAVNVRGLIKESLKEQGIETGIHFYGAHLHEYEFTEHSREELMKALPNATNYSSSCITLPLYPEITSGEIEFVVESLVRTAKGCYKTFNSIDK